MTELRDLLKRLSETFGPSGNERAVRALVRAEIEGWVDRIDVDALGNLIAFKAGTGPEPRLKVLLAAHMDEVGFMITKINKSGTLSFSAASIDARLLLAKRVVVGEAGIPGVICSPVPHLQKGDSAHRVLDAEDLFIDIGAPDEGTASGKVSLGDYATFATRYTVLNDDPHWPTVRGKAFDDRAGCAALIALLAGGQTYPVDVYAAFTVQEEVGLRGARVVAHRAAPDAAFALEGTICDDLPKPQDEDSTSVTRLGDGPAITLMDRSVVAHPGLLALLQKVAEQDGVAVQFKAPGLGGTDAGAIHLAREGVPAIAVATPCRYIHGPAAILNLNDLQALVRLMEGALRRIGPGDLSR